MTPLRRAIAAASLWASLLSPLAALAQAPSPVPALPDSERRTSYSISGTTCACSVGFALYGDGTDYQNWIEVWLNGVEVTYNDATFGWTVTSPSGSIGTLARPITDAIVTFTNVQTGTVQIAGARRPRRLSQFSENRGVAARDLNQALTDIIAQNRETWDKVNDVTGRGLFFAPGNTVGPMPLPSACVSAILSFDTTGLNPKCITVPAAALSPGVSVLSPSTNGGVLFDNAGILGDSKTLPSGLTHPGTQAFTGTSGQVTGLNVQVNGVTCNATTGTPANCSITATAGTITSGTTLVAGGITNQLLFDNGGTLGEVTKANNGVLITSGAGAPSISSTLPSAVQGNITAVGTVASGTFNGTLTSGTTAIASGTTTDVCFNDGGVLNCGSAGLQYTKATGKLVATLFNNVTLTAPAATATLTLGSGKTISIPNSLTLAGTDATTLTFPGTSDTIPGLAQNNAFTGINTFGRVNLGVRPVTANYTINSSGNDYEICVRQTAPITITVPATPTTDTYTVIDCSGTDTTNPITLSGNGGSLINGNATIVMNSSTSTRHDSVGLCYTDGTSQWQTC